MDDLSLTNLIADALACSDAPEGTERHAEYLAACLAPSVLLRDQLEQVGWMSFFDDGHPSYASFTTELPNDVGETLVPVYRMKEGQ